jgi:hypothetical protein
VQVRRNASEKTAVLAVFTILRASVLKRKERFNRFSVVNISRIQPWTGDLKEFLPGFSVLIESARIFYSSNFLFSET